MANTFVTTADDRRMGLFTAGDPGAVRIVIVCHPTPGSATFDPDPAVTDRAAMRIVALDRPGYGTSDPLPPGTPHRVAGRADDLTGYLKRSERSAATATRTDMGSVGVVGWGTGSLVAASIAARHPDLVDRLALIGPPAPATALRMAQRAATAEPGLAALGLDAEDADLARHPGLLGRVDRMIADAFTRGREGVDADLELMADDGWVDDLPRLRAATRLWLGRRDPWVAEDDVEWWGRRIEGARAVPVRDAGALTIASAWRAVLDHVAPLPDARAQRERDSERGRVPAVDPVHPDRG